MCEEKRCDPRKVAGDAPTEALLFALSEADAEQLRGVLAADDLSESGLRKRRAVYLVAAGCETLEVSQRMEVTPAGALGLLAQGLKLLPGPRREAFRGLVALVEDVLLRAGWRCPTCERRRSKP